MQDGMRPTVLFFGRIWEYKGLEYLIRAEPLIAAEVPDAKIVIAGAGRRLHPVPAHDGSPRALHRLQRIRDRRTVQHAVPAGEPCGASVPRGVSKRSHSASHTPSRNQWSQRRSEVSLRWSTTVARDTSCRPAMSERWRPPLCVCCRDRTTLSAHGAQRQAQARRGMCSSRGRASDPRCLPSGPQAHVRQRRRQGNDKWSGYSDTFLRKPTLPSETRNRHD